MNIEVSDHIHYLSGYMEAVGNMLSTDLEVFTLTARIVESVEILEQELGFNVGKETPIERAFLDFEKGLKSLFQVDPRDRVLFYLTEYVMWFEEYTDSCNSSRLYLVGANVQEKHLAWFLEINSTTRVFIFMQRQARSA